MANAAVAVAFSEAPAIFANHERQVVVMRRRGGAEPLLQQQLAMRGAEQVVAADDAADVLTGVVDDDGELVARQALFRGDEEIARRGGDVVRVLADDMVDERRRSIGNAEAPSDARLVERGNSALARLETQLTQTPYLVGERLTLADIALVAYTRVAHEGGFDLSQYPAVKAWVGRVEVALGL